MSGSEMTVRAPYGAALPQPNTPLPSKQRLRWRRICRSCQHLRSLCMGREREGPTFTCAMRAHFGAHSHRFYLNTMESVVHPMVVKMWVKGIFRVIVQGTLFFGRHSVNNLKILDASEFNDLCIRTSSSS